MKNHLNIFFLAGVLTLADAGLKCVAVNKTQCGEHEAFNTCGSICTEPKCPRLGFEELACAAVCVEGCFCADGFVRDPSGKCVQLDKCPQVQCPANEHYTDCGARCEPSCETPVLLLCSYICMPGCVCDAGFVRNSEGVCVAPQQCPNPKCSENEEFQQFGPGCEPSCQNPGEMLCKAPSHPGCFCKENYVRNENNKCVLREECPKGGVKCEGANEVFNECGSTCGDLRCDLQSFAAVSCIAGCNSGCFCADGYVRNSERACVLVENCPPVGHCPANEEWNDCGPADGCEASCANPDLLNVFCIQLCVPKCVCQAGFVRHSDGYCVPRDSCPKEQCLGENEVYSSCGSGCGDLSCETPSFAAVTCPAVCNQGCFCAEGFVRNSEGKCVIESECPRCPAKERYTQCGAACYGTCANQNPLICPAICMSGCVCAFGLVRNEDGVCVEPSQCPGIVSDCGENESFKECGSGCGDLTCNIQSFAALICPDVCVSSCFCNEGFVRNSQGKCVPPKTCPSNGCNKNEVWNDCGPVDSCEASCKNPDLIDTLCPDVCIKKCVCQDGFVRDANWNCVPRDTCSAVQCGENEAFTDCGSGCGDLSCSVQVFEMCPAVCKVGCFCAQGYVRDSNGRCIFPEKCPKSDCDTNEEYLDCGSPCESSCDHLEPTYCKAKCQPGCFCKSGFVRDAANKCVEPRKCPALQKEIK